ncbi:MaoC family dehydratase [Pararhodospirillum oryzae]|uniref:MaoC family dehydratase n=1 Tax=Pararhodospirillum oryzae TaxID=478448 RepID=UPI0011BEE0FC|nr:MaoC family dehydratase [Pararhodospirillum oryzae]
MSAADPTLYYFEDLTEGMTASLAKTVSESDIYLFAGVTMDTNPAHVNEEYMKTSPFGGRIAHGMLAAGFISAVLGTRLPGPGAIYVGQSLRFKAPVRIGDTVTATAEVTSLVPAKRFVTLRTFCTVAGKVVVDGEATVMVPARPASA